MNADIKILLILLCFGLHHLLRKIFGSSAAKCCAVFCVHQLVANFSHEMEMNGNRWLPGTVGNKYISKTV